MATATTIERKRLIRALGGDELVARQLEATTSDVIDMGPEIAAAKAAADAAQGDADEALSRVDGLAIGVFGRRPAAPLDVRPGDLIQVMRDAAGYVVGVDLGQLAVAVTMLMPKPTNTPCDEAQSILAARTFNRN